MDDIITDDIKQDYTEAAFDRVSRDGVIYGIPLDGDLVALYYNKEILEQNGVTPPTTWDELNGSGKIKYR
ncbi:MAG: extracellular solute-binding protein [Lachnospiraceae bacterium]